MVKVVWTQRGLNDLEDIGDYISKDSNKYAKLTLENLVDTALLIEINPFVGRFVPETNDKTIREIIKVFETVCGESRMACIGLFRDMDLRGYATRYTIAGN